MRVRTRANLLLYVVSKLTEQRILFQPVPLRNDPDAEWYFQARSC